MKKNIFFIIFFVVIATVAIFSVLLGIDYYLDNKLKTNLNNIITRSNNEEKEFFTIVNQSNRYFLVKNPIFNFKRIFSQNYEELISDKNIILVFTDEQYQENKFKSSNGDIFFSFSNKAEINSITIQMYISDKAFSSNDSQNLRTMNHYLFTSIFYSLYAIENIGTVIDSKEILQESQNTAQEAYDSNLGYPFGMYEK